MLSLEQKLKKTKIELEQYKILCENMENNDKSSYDFNNYVTCNNNNNDNNNNNCNNINNYSNFNNTNNKYIFKCKLSNINYEKQYMQNKLIIESFQKIIKSILPKELAEHSILKLNDITDFDSLDDFINNLIRNQITLAKDCNFQNISNFNECKTFCPLKMYSLFEQLKNFANKFKEFLSEVRKFDILI